MKLLLNMMTSVGLTLNLLVEGGGDVRDIYI